MRILLYILLTIFLCSCAPSSMILLTALNEERIFNYNSTRDQIEKKLGTAITEIKYDQPVSLYEFRFPKVIHTENCKIERQQIGVPPRIYIPKPDDPRKIAVQSQYKITGKIIRQGEAGDFNAIAYMTFGLSEIIAIPTAVSEVSSESPVMNTFDVWYSSEGDLLAYSWRACDITNE